MVNPSLADLSNCSSYNNTQYWDFSTYEMSGNDISGTSGKFCYIPITDTCPDPLSKASVLLNRTNDTSYNICGRESTQLLSSVSNLSTQITSSNGTMVTTKFGTFNLQLFFMVILYVFLAVVFYAIFGVGTFIFWTKYAATELIKTGCYEGTTLLDRHYPYKYNQLPYNTSLFDNDNCKKMPKTVMPSIDKCPQSNRIATYRADAQSLGVSVWDNIFYFVRGFPYNGINKDKEVKLKNINGNYFIGLMCIGIVFIMMLFYGNTVKPNIVKSVLAGLAVFGLLIILLVLYKFKSPITGEATDLRPKYNISKYNISTYKLDNVNPIIPIFGALTTFLVVMIIMSRISGSNNIILVLSILFGITFITLSGVLFNIEYPIELQKLKDIDPNKTYPDIRFLPAIRKGYYYMKKSSINSFKTSIIWGRKSVNNIFKFIGNSGGILGELYDVFIIIFGVVLIPAIIALCGFVRLVASFLGGIGGGFSWEKSTSTSTSKFKLTDEKPDTLLSGIALLLFGPNLAITIISSIINVLFFILSYTLVPLTHPKIIMNIISCNLKKLGFLFGASILGMFWALRDSTGTSIVMPNNILIWMTITFAIISLHDVVTG